MFASTWQDLIGTAVAERYKLRDLVYAGRHQAEFAAATEEDSETLVSVTMEEPEPAEIEEELAAISRARELRHPNILRLMDAGECVINDTKLLYIVTESAQGTLASATRPDPGSLLEDLLAPLEWLHSQNLVYRNLDPDTVVQVNGRWKLADLSQVHAAGQYDAAEAAGRNAPPEADAGWILPAWDFWTIGVLLRGLMGGETAAVRAPLDAIVAGCLEADPARRLSAKDIRRMLKPEPIPIRTDEPSSNAEPLPAAPTRSRVLVVAAAVIAILGILLFVMWPSHRENAPPIVVPPPSVVTPPPAAVPQPRAESRAQPAPESQSAVAAKAPPAAPVRRSTPAVAEDQQIGRADYFSDDLEGHVTASGEEFSNSAMTAASRHFPMGSRLRVTGLKSGRSVTVRVNDRGGERPGFVVTVTRHAAEQLGFVKQGSTRVKVELLK